MKKRIYLVAIKKKKDSHSKNALIYEFPSKKQQQSFLSDLKEKGFLDQFEYLTWGGLKSELS